MTTQFIVCPKCDAIYHPDICKSVSEGKFKATFCSYKPFPNHPQARKRNPCGAALMTTVKISSKSGSTTAYRPIKVYPYNSLTNAIVELVKKPSFLHNSEVWRRRNNFREFGYMCDLYDGDIWGEYSEFLAAPYNFLLTLNVDWFCPFEHSQYSVGAVYLTIQNLPISIRNKPENIILVGIIPGPTEPHLNLNSYLAPLVSELNVAWSSGIQVPVMIQNQQVTLTIRLALACVACDIPATRKVCGFLGHRATLGCNKCLKRFKQMIDREKASAWTNYSGFNPVLWDKRTHLEHRQHCEAIKAAFEEQGTQTSLQKEESAHGLRYSILLDLPYFDPIRYAIIDPMHNLFLGTGKHVMEVWLERHPILRQNFANLESQIKAFIIPEGIGRLRCKISSHFGGFTADQWRNWITIYSPILLWSVLERESWDCWILFVQAVKMITGCVLSVADIEKSNSLFQEFGTQFEALYGERKCTINMHLHLHLMQSLKDYGPARAFWLYSFERFNGILGSFHTNNTHIEAQIMAKFLDSQFIQVDDTSFVDNEEFYTFLPKSYMPLHHSQGSNSVLSIPLNNVVQFLTQCTGPINNISVSSLESFQNMVNCIGPFSETVLTSQELKRIDSLLCEMFGPQAKAISRFALKFRKATIGDDIVGSTLPGASVASSFVLAHWPGQLLNTTPEWHMGQIQYFLQIEFLTDQTHSGKTQQIQFAFVHWRKPHTYKNLFGEDVAQVCESTILPQCVWSYLPLHRISKRCACITMLVTFPDSTTETVTIACPIALRLKL